MPSIKLKYFGYHPYNNPTHSERNVELPLAFWFLQRFQYDLGNVVEVGEVTPFYRKARHVVFDPAAEFPDTVRKSAVEVDYGGKHLLSISTLEHIGTGDYGQTPDPDLLPTALAKMLSSETYFITFALGYNRQLEGLIQDKPFLVLERIAPTKWRQTPSRKLGAYRYHSPWYAGNAICVLTHMENLQFEFSRQSVLSMLRRCRARNWSWRNFLKGTWQEILDERRICSQTS